MPLLLTPSLNIPSTCSTVEVTFDPSTSTADIVYVFPSNHSVYVAFATGQLVQVRARGLCVQMHLTVAVPSRPPDVLRALHDCRPLPVPVLLLLLFFPPSMSSSSSCSAARPRLWRHCRDDGPSFRHQRPDGAPDARLRL